MAHDPGIYVEIWIQGDLEDVWRRTQTPALHEQWDLRFTRIEYLPRASEQEPQRFLYSTRIGFGLGIDGEGESTGTREASNGLRTSALRFSSADWKSLIEEGSGYWQYHPVEGGVRFLTWYDYRTRFGALGTVVDLVFRPLMGWATAWSFDRLRLWIERGIPPATSLRLAVIHGLARVGIAFTWIWHGLVPKLWFSDMDEKVMLGEAGLSVLLLPVIGVLEIAFGMLILLLWRWRGLYILNALLMLAALVAVYIKSPTYITAAFNPVTLNAGMILLSIIGYLSAADLPSAARCLRRRKESS